MIAHSSVVSGETNVEVEVPEVIASQCWERLGYGVPNVVNLQPSCDESKSQFFSVLFFGGMWLKECLGGWQKRLLGDGEQGRAQVFGAVGSRC